MLGLAVAFASSAIGAISCYPRAHSDSGVAIGTEDAAFVSLGNLQFGKAPTKGETQLSEFLFGVPPEPPLRLIKPIAVTVDAQGAWIADVGFAGVFRHDFSTSTIRGMAGAVTLQSPSSVICDAAETLYLADTGTGRVSAVSASGQVLWTFGGARPEFAPASLALVGDELFVSSAKERAIVVLDRTTGAYRRTIGIAATAKLRMPLGIAVQNSELFVVDAFARCIQIFNVDGAWRRTLLGTRTPNGPTLARPKDIAVGPDGTIFISDATEGVIYAIDPQGRKLAALGEANEHNDGLALPAGIAIARADVRGERSLRFGRTPQYYVLVCEQLENPGVRVFAWFGESLSAPRPVPISTQRANSGVVPTVANPHWNPTGCRQCHDLGTPTSIPIQQTDALCLRCHDGKQASAEPHPIGWPAESDFTHPAPGWPLHDGRIACLTCHDVIRHCDVSAPRPNENSGMVRMYDPQHPLDFCTRCHVADNLRFNPHRSDKSARLTGADSCAICHVDTPTLPYRSNDNAHLHQQTTALCLNCHKPHADPAPNGHLDQMQYVTAPVDLSAKLPLDAGKITCATCHNPHPPQAEDIPWLGIRAARPEDATIDLRMNYENLCTACHPK
ncbi:MAG: hypothetical protein AB7N71_13765 [Phycisphaerae bacterium]